jgi:hypothetical protein
MLQDTDWWVYELPKKTLNTSPILQLLKAAHHYKAVINVKSRQLRERLVAKGLCHCRGLRQKPLSVAIPSNQSSFIAAFIG